MLALQILCQLLTGILTMASSSMEKYLRLLSDQVIDNVEIITPAEAGQDFMLHVSMNTKIKEFVPRIGDRQAPSEDRTVPRVCVAPHLIGCMLGYGSIFADFFNQGASDGENGWLGGWAIYAIDFEECLKPNKRLVYDAAVSEEHWLVACNPDKPAYIPRMAGKIFVRSIELTARSKETPDQEMTFLIEVTEPKGIKFNNKIFLGQGYWRLVGPNPKHIRNHKDVKDYEFTSISKEDYVSAKNESAALLNFQEPANFLKW